MGTGLTGMWWFVPRFQGSPAPRRRFGRGCRQGGAKRGQAWPGLDGIGEFLPLQVAPACRDDADDPPCPAFSGEDRGTRSPEFEPAVEHEHPQEPPPDRAFL